MKFVRMRKLCCLWITSLFILVGCTSGKNLLDREVLQQETNSGMELSELQADGYQGEPYVEIENNEPDFTEKEYTQEAFEKYSNLDELGRCGVAFANICKEIMPTQKRGAIGMVKPSGWHTVKYEVVDGKYLYNRCHLIGYQLAGENANEKNLITGTRYLNVEGMLPFEEQVTEYVKETGNHVLYRVTPVYQGNNLVAEGVRMEGYSVEDQGEGVSFHVFVYNVQPGVEIDYTTGDSSLEGTKDSKGQKEKQSADRNDAQRKQKKSVGKENIKEKQEEQTETYIINKNTKKFHLPGCDSVEKTLPKNRKSYTGSREELLNQGYEPCNRCKP